MSNNIYSTSPGFGLRVHHARTALIQFALSSEARPYSRAFDNCFENYDGDAVIWQLIRYVIEGDELLEKGIRRMGGRLFSDWMNVYDPSNHDRAKKYYNFLSEMQISNLGEAK